MKRNMTSSSRVITGPAFILVRQAWRVAHKRQPISRGG